MKISLIVAMAENRAIGIGNRLPWHLPEDLRHFKSLTVGHPMIMGRKTFESIGKPLPERRNIVVSRKPDYAPAGVEVVSTLEGAFELARQSNGNFSSDEVFVIGGAEIYQQTLRLADRLYLTLVHASPEADAFFPAWAAHEFREIKREDKDGHPAFSFLVLERQPVTR